jgi:DNA-binding NtrC family response regulator
VTVDEQSGFFQPTKIAYVDGQPHTLHLRRIELVLAPGLEDERELHFDQDVVSVGTAEDNDVVLEDETVSRHHCRILQEDEHYLLVDRGSTNGTFLKGVRIREAFLTPGAIICLGNTQIRFNPVDEEVPLEPIEEERYGEIVGRSRAMREVFGVLEKIAPTHATVVIEGETGTGKEVVARTLHQQSKRSDGDFIVFDCGAVPENLIESELFGHEKGSFTGALMTRKGLFEMAEGGTLFLDELGELALDLQPKLLRVLEQREVRRVGSNEPIPVNVRVVAATNRSLEEEVEAGRFREDLFYRLSVVRTFLPPLRERVEDIPLLVRHFLHTSSFNRDDDDRRKVHDITSEAIACMEAYDWPGNVRELQNVIERACSFVEGDTIGLEDLPFHLVEHGEEALEGDDEKKWSHVPARARLSEQPFKEAKEEWISSFERDYILELITRHGGNISQASREADIDRKYFRKLMKKYDIEADEVS